MPRNLTIKKSFWQKGFSNSALFLKANIHQKPQFRQLDGTTKAKLQHGYNRLLRLATAVCCGAAPVLTAPVPGLPILVFNTSVVE